MSTSSALQLPPYDHKPQAYSGPSKEVVTSQRSQYLAPVMFLYYDEPFMIVEGSMQYVYDETGKRYLDGFGGIATISIGHAHPYLNGGQSNEIHCE